MTDDFRCSRCHRSVIALWILGDERRRVCLTCIWEAFEVTRALTLGELLRRLRTDKP